MSRWTRWIIVANRLPFTLSADSRQITTASGGLVSALNGVQSKAQKIWLGCAPEHLTKENWPSVRKNLTSSSWVYQPIFTPTPLYNLYYNGCCNDVLWPLLHYQTELVQFSSKSWKAYREMNERFATSIAEIAHEDDLIWIHDFHLFLVPKILRGLRPKLRSGFFLHVPFPSSEVFRQLPVREEILDSLLHADLVGFHDYSYLRHFCSSLLRLLGLESELLSVKRGTSVTRLGVFPVSIDTELFAKRSREPKVRALAAEMKKDCFVFLGVDRLDYMKGLDLKLKAFQNLLRNYPHYREKVILLQVAVPTRREVPVYARLARETARLVGEINGEFSTPNWTPIQYIYSSVTNEQLIALYKTANALLVSSKRDGMNLVALEYIASQDKENPGVVLLSEFTGALSTLSQTLALNPWDLDDAAKKMVLAMEMPNQEKLQRLKTMQDFLHQYTASHWAESFIEELGKDRSIAQKGPQLVNLAPEAYERSLQLVKNAILGLKPTKITLFLDFDGTLVPIQPTPELAILNEEDKQAIATLCRYLWLDIVIVSGRDSRFLNLQFNQLPVRLAAEHGAKFYDPITQRWKRRVHRSRSNWYPTALKLISDYTERVPHSQLEKKHFAIAWHYRQAPPEYGDFQARKLAEELEFGLANLPVNIIRGKKVIEVRAIEADKGAFANFYLNDAPNGQIALAFGDDRTDEDIFYAIRSRGISFKIGNEETSADYCIPLQTDVLKFLLKLCASLDTSLRTAPRPYRNLRDQHGNVRPRV